MRSRRTNRLIRPGFQLRLSASFLGLALLGQLLQFVLVAYLLQLAARDVSGGGDLAGPAAVISLKAFLLAAAATTPLILAFGVFLTHRIAGPAYRLESFARHVAHGEETAPVSLRKGDEFQELAEAINLATAPLRARAATADHGPAANRATSTDGHDSAGTRQVA